MSKIHFGLTAMALVMVVGMPPSASADAWHPRHKGHVSRGAPVYKYEDSCGCLIMTYDYHRELKYTYGPYVDPRSFDQTEPHYYYGAVKAYPRYWSTRTAQPY
jgi:hypothetical protein